MNYLKKKDGFQGQRAIVIPPTILASFCKMHPVVKQLYVTDIGYYPNAQHHHRQRPRGTEGHIIIYCVSGKGKARIEEQAYTISAGEFILLPANKAHEYSADENHPWTIYWVHFAGTNSENFIHMMIQKMGTPVFPISFQENRLKLFEEIYSNLEKGYSIDNICYASLGLQYFLASCCFDTNYNLQSKKEKNDSIDLCITYMQKNIKRTLTLGEIAGAANLSPSHITTLFKKKTGFTLIEYFNQMKTQKACQYLLFTNLRINEIASRLGIDDPYYFSRMFTKIIGKSPLQYRCSKRDS
jgi:AraC-like DNA-binding protein/mannose-6-phosphate isomerase-like protein (cupin superfamily)